MKKWIVLALMFSIGCAPKPTAPIASPGNASQAPAPQVASDEQTYNSLNAPEKDARPRDKKGRPSIGAAISEKSSGGVTCRKITPVYPNAKSKYECTTRE